MIVTLPNPDLCTIRVAKASTDAMRLAKIKRRFIDPAWFTLRDAGRIHRQIGIRSDRQAVVENAAASLDARQIEEAVIGQIDDRRLVGLRGERGTESSMPPEML